MRLVRDDGLTAFENVVLASLPHFLAVLGALVGAVPALSDSVAHSLPGYALAQRTSDSLAFWLLEWLYLLICDKKYGLRIAVNVISVYI